MKKFITLFIVIVVVIALINSDYFRNKNTKTFTVTADTNVSQVKGLSKYVTQEEVDSFAFRYWHIDYNSIPNININEIPKNNIQEKEPKLDVILKLLLKSKQTNKILKFISDNNLSINHTMYGGTTPIMYSAYWNDTNTTQELINLGADIRKRDKFGLWSMAYAIANFSTDTVKLLMKNGVKFTEVKFLQGHLYCPSYDVGMTIVYDITNHERTIFPQLTQCLTNHKGPAGEITDIIGYLLRPESIELAKIALENGVSINDTDTYEPYADKPGQKRYRFRENFETMIDFDQVLKLILDSNVNMDLFVTKDEVVQSYKEEFQNALRHVDKLAQYIEHSNDFIVGEEILGLHNYENIRFSEQSKKERGEKYNKIIDKEHIKIPLDNLVLDMEFYKIKDGFKYFEFLDYISLDYLVNNITSYTKYKEFAKEMQPKFDKWLENKIANFGVNKNSTFEILKDYFDMQRDSWIAFEISHKDPRLVVTIHNGKVIDYYEHVKELNEKYSNKK